MIKNRIELIRDGKPRALLTWHLPDGAGGFTPVAFQFSEDLSDEAKQQIIDIARRPQKVLGSTDAKRAMFGTSDHFLALPHILERTGYRTRLFGAVYEKHPLEDRPLEGL